MTTAAPVPTAAPTAPPVAGATTLTELRAGQPAALAVPGARERIRSMNRDAAQHVVVLDDDPTGSQVVHGLPVLTRWDDDDLRWAFAHPARAFFVLTNSRSLPARQTDELLRDLGARLHRVGAEVGTEVVLLSRSDSTLRGHYPLETDVLAQVAAGRGAPYDAVLLVPAYLDAGRVTVDDVHYARDGVAYVPVGSTDYATDDAFGYTSSRLSQWVQEKTGSRVLARDVLQLRLADIRGGGVERVAELLLGARGGRVVTVDALDESDLEVVALALGAAERTGWRALCRVGPSFVPVRTGIDRRPPLLPVEVAGDPPRAGHGLVVVGSHVELTTRQVAALLQLPGLEPVELDVDALADPARRQAETER
ncbi:MAG TPA: four-carbon acid sugar kinase family protein, partial [Actinomycetales bacterium]